MGKGSPEIYEYEVAIDKPESRVRSEYEYGFLPGLGKITMGKIDHGVFGEFWIWGDKEFDRENIKEPGRRGILKAVYAS